MSKNEKQLVLILKLKIYISIHWQPSFYSLNPHYLTNITETSGPADRKETRSKRAPWLSRRGLRPFLGQGTLVPSCLPIQVLCGDMKAGHGCLGFAVQYFSSAFRLMSEYWRVGEFGSSCLIGSVGQCWFLFSWNEQIIKHHKDQVSGGQKAVSPRLLRLQEHFVWALSEASRPRMTAQGPALLRSSEAIDPGPNSL